MKIYYAIEVSESLEPDQISVIVKYKSFPLWKDARNFIKELKEKNKGSNFIEATEDNF